MRRIHQLGITFTVFLAVWVSLLHQSGALKSNKSVLHNFFDTTSPLHVFLWCLPLICIVVFAIHSLVYIIYSVMYFPTCPKAAEMLKRDMKRTQKELVKLGVFTPKQIKEMNSR